MVLLQDVFLDFTETSKIREIAAYNFVGEAAACSLVCSPVSDRSE